MIAGAFLGAFLNAVGWFLYCVVISSFVAGHLDIVGEWGVNFIVGFLGTIVGFFIGGIVGFFEFSKRQSVAVFSILSFLLHFFLVMSLYNHPATQANINQVNLNWWLGNIFIFLPPFLTSIFIAWTIAYIFEAKKIIKH